MNRTQPHSMRAGGQGQGASSAAGEARTATAKATRRGTRHLTNSALRSIRRESEKCASGKERHNARARIVSGCGGCGSFDPRAMGLTC